MQFKQWIKFIGTALLATTFAVSSQAAIWSSSEVHYSSGDYIGSGGKHDLSATVLTFQHASGHKYGKNFFFVDHTRSDTGSSFYGEWYSTFSLGAITGSDMSFGMVKDVGLLAGLNLAPGPSSMYTLPGVSLALDLPGFAFANLDITGYNNIKTNGTSGEESSYMLDFNWAYPFKAGGLSWSVEGHAEYIAGRDMKDGSTTLEDWILMQPQLRMDLGEALGNEAGNFFVGIEYQYWKNKYGVKDKNESMVQLQTVWNF